MLLRSAEPRDLAAINDIYNRAVETSTATFDTELVSVEARQLWLQDHQSATRPAIVAENDSGTVIGWAALSSWSPRCAYARAAEVSIYIHAQHRGKGVGRALLAELINRAREAGLGVLLARVADHSEASLALHRSMGFETIGLMRRVGEKFGRILDVELMDLHLE